MANAKDITELIIRQWYEDVVNKRPNVGLGRVLILTPYLPQKHLIQHYVGVTYGEYDQPILWLFRWCRQHEFSSYHLC